MRSGDAAEAVNIPLAGVKELLDVMVKLLANPTEGNPPDFLNGEGDAAQPLGLVTAALDDIDWEDEIHPCLRPHLSANCVGILR